MKGQQIGYRRVSTIDQNTARQLMDVELDRIFEDKCSGKDTNRPALQECLAYLREGDTLHVHSIDRLARNLHDLETIVNTLTGKGVSVAFHKENMIFTADAASPMNKLMLQLLGSFAEFERSMIRERQREGIAVAKAQGKFRGGQRKLTAEQEGEIRTRRAAGESAIKLAEEFGVTRATVYNIIKAH